MTVRTGEFVAKFIDSDAMLDDAIQPNGLDLSIGEIYKLSGVAELSDDEYTKTDRDRVPVNGHGDYVLGTGPHIIEYDETIEIPDDCVGIVLPRSRMLRCGLQVDTALWDAGYKGKGEGALFAHTPAKLEKDMRVAQMVFLDADEAEEKYDGEHQGENL